MMLGYLFMPLFFAVSFASASPFEKIRSCRLEDGSHAMLLAENTIDGKRLHLKINGINEPIFSDIPRADFVGEIVLAKCVHGVLIFAINYGSPYLKGEVVRKRKNSEHIDRISYAEKALPRWLYFNRKFMRLIIPNVGNEVSYRYLIYDYSVESGQPDEARGSNTLPNERYFNVGLVD